MATFYFDYQSGADGNSGRTADAPFKTLNKASSLFASKALKPGDRLLFKRGVTWPCTSYEQCLNIRDSSGAMGNPIYLGPYGQGDARPVFDARGTKDIWPVTHELTWSGGGQTSHITLEGLEIKGSRSAGLVYLVGTHDWLLRDLHLHGVTRTGTRWAGGVIIRTNSHHIRLENCRIHDIAGEGVYIGDGHATLEKPDRAHHITLAGCHISDCLSEAVDIKMFCEYITIHDCRLEDAGGGSSPVLSLGGQYNRVFKTEVRGGPNHAPVAGIRFAYSSWLTGPGQEESWSRHNVVERCLIEGIYGSYGAIDLASDDGRIINCTIANSNIGVRFYDTGLSPATPQAIKNTIFDNVQKIVTFAKGSKSGLDESHNYVTASNTVFANKDRYDLLEDSPCRNNGDPAVTSCDYAGAAPDQGWLEYGHPEHRLFAASFQREADLGRVTAVNVAVGQEGLVVSPAKDAPSYIQVDLKNLERLYLTFRLNIEGLSAGANDGFRLLNLNDAQGREAAFLYLHTFNSSQNRLELRGAIRDSGGEGNYTGWIGLKDGPLPVALEWWRGHDSKQQGEMTVYVEGVAVQRIDGIGNDALTVDNIQLGAIKDAGASIAGRMTIDSLVIDPLRRVGLAPVAVPPPPGPEPEPEPGPIDQAALLERIEQLEAEIEKLKANMETSQAEVVSRVQSVETAQTEVAGQVAEVEISQAELAAHLEAIQPIIKQLIAKMIRDAQTDVTELQSIAGTLSADQTEAVLDRMKSAGQGFLHSVETLPPLIADNREAILEAALHAARTHLGAAGGAVAKGGGPGTLGPGDEGRIDLAAMRREMLAGVQAVLGGGAS
ncbi:MAG: right-handed parallel beta-helix repeat-containing protein [Anaerolineae bacterium]